jgi:ribose-phosphate pyrophosphokinase
MKKVRLVQEKEIDVIFSTFPAGEEYVRINGELTDEPIFIDFLGADASTIMKGCLIADAVKQYNPNIKTIASFSYFPYGRQDRVCKEGESFSLKFFIEMLKLRFDRVEAIDTHSTVTNDLFGMFGFIEHEPLDEDFIDTEDFSNGEIKEGISLKEHIEQIDDFHKTDMFVVSPDKGAVERSKKVANYLNIDKVVTCDKIRSEVGIDIQINSHDEEYISSGASYKTAIIYDDICDGGGTFLSLAKQLKKINKNITFILVFTHGIFSKGVEVFKKEDGFLKVFVHENEFNVNCITKE